jgi:predicted PurR-regulated permease PerM
MPKKVEISHRTIVFTVFFLLSLWFLYLIRDILLQLFIALLIMAILNPLVSRLSKWRIPRGISAFLAYLVVIGAIVGIFAGLVPPLVSQTASFAINLPKYLTNIGVNRILSDEIIGQLLSQLGGVPGQLVKFGVSLFSNILDVFAVLIFAFYLLLVREKLDDQLGFFFGDEKKHQVGRFIDILEARLGGWARGELLLMVIIGAATYLGLVLLGIPFALPLALLAGLFEMIPYLGPIVAAIPAVVIGLSISPLMGLAAAGLALLIQQLENYILVPKVMEKSVGVSPIITLIALAIGFKLAGVVGVVISVPAVITLQVIGSQYLLKK